MRARGWMKALVAAGGAAFVLSACAPGVLQRVPTESGAPASFSAQAYERAAAQGRTVFRVDPAASLVTVEVRRGGSLARLGHDHVIAGHDVQGYLDPEAGRADMYVALDRLVVDEPALRQAAGFDTQPSAEAVAGTRRNMLEHVLDTARYPFASISVGGMKEGGAIAPLSVTLHDVSRTLRAPVHIDATADQMVVTGELELRQTDFGIVPLSVLGGAIVVQDSVLLRFRIRAVRLPTP
jgi:hypothetical protein